MLTKLTVALTALALFLITLRRYRERIDRERWVDLRFARVLHVDARPAPAAVFRRPGHSHPGSSPFSGARR